MIDAAFHFRAVLDIFKDCVVTHGNGFDVDDGILPRARKIVILKLAERPLRFAYLRRDFAFEDYFRPGRHFEVNGAALDQFDVFLQQG